MEEMASYTSTRHVLKSEAKQPQKECRCPRCDSTNTKFCYYNNYSLSQPRYYCKACLRYWTEGASQRSSNWKGSRRTNLSMLSSSPSEIASSEIPYRLTPSRSAVAVVAAAATSSKVHRLNLQTTHEGQDLNLGLPIPAIQETRRGSAVLQDVLSGLSYATGQNYPDRVETFYPNLTMLYESQTETLFPHATIIAARPSILQDSINISSSDRAATIIVQQPRNDVSHPARTLFFEPTLSLQEFARHNQDRRGMHQSDADLYPPDVILEMTLSGPPFTSSINNSSPDQPSDDTAQEPTTNGTITLPAAESVHRDKTSMTYLQIIGQVGLTSVTLITGAGDNVSLSHHAKILLYSSAAFTVLGFFACLSALSTTKVPARVLTRIGHCATACAFLAIMGTLLPDCLNLWIIGIASVACFLITMSLQS